MNQQSCLVFILTEHVLGVNVFWNQRGREGSMLKSNGGYPGTWYMVMHYTSTYIIWVRHSLISWPHCLLSIARYSPGSPQELGEGTSGRGHSRVHAAHLGFSNEASAEWIEKSRNWPTNPSKSHHWKAKIKEYCRGKRCGSEVYSICSILDPPTQ